MTYIDGYLIPVPAARRDEYVALARRAAPVFRRYGALRVVEAWGDDVPDGKLTSFPLATRAEPGEAVVFAWVEWPSRAARDEGMQKAMQDPFFAGDGSDMPFDGKRMMWGGFEAIVDA